MKKMKQIIFSILPILLSFETVGAETYDNYVPGNLKQCGSGLLTNIPALIPEIVSIAVTVIQIAVPVVLVIMGMLDMFKGITAQKEEEIKKNQQLFVKRLIAAALVFFSFVVVKLVVSLAADNSNIINCAECFLKNNCEVTA